MYTASTVRFTNREAGLNRFYSDADRNRFAAKVRVDASGCWLWTASRLGKYYGQFVVMAPGGGPKKERERHLYAHRVAWELCHGAIPDGQYVLHRCDTPLCVNPDHLFLGDQFANMADAKAKGRILGRRPRRTPQTTTEAA